ncbi:MAG TPA: YHS domain-containing protein [Hellea balneolensis]|uniref:YHS domain-containing protein n=1 Tax=Hellea balneolensis TaxID=287478 RepID=A0A7V5NX26_9PROT|nr:YHS domain-containing protein [Hellea balneolensis]
MKSWFKLILAALILCVGVGAVSEAAHAESAPIYTSWRNNLAVGGYDVVSFYQNSPVKGSSRYTTRWRGADWQFASQDNLEKFQNNPEKYAPAYGGYCAWAIAKGKLARGSPKYWTIRDGRLFLNFNKKIQDRWLKNRDAFIAQADKNWPGILGD